MGRRRAPLSSDLPNLDSPFLHRWCMLVLAGFRELWIVDVPMQHYRLPIAKSPSDPAKTTARKSRLLEQPVLERIDANQNLMTDLRWLESADQDERRALQFRTPSVGHQPYRGHQR